MNNIVFDEDTLGELKTSQLKELYLRNFGFKPRNFMSRRELIDSLVNIRVVSKPKATSK